VRKTFVVLALILLLCSDAALVLTFRLVPVPPPRTPVALELSPSPTTRPTGQSPTLTPSPTRPVTLTPPPTRPGPTPTLSPSPTRPRPTPIPTAEPSTLEKLLTTEMPTRDLYALATRLKRVEGLTARVVHEEPPRYAIGDEAPFWIGDQVRRTYFSTTATLRYATPHLYMWVQDGLEIDQEALERSAQEFEEKIYPTNRRTFGSEWTPGVDSDPHLHILNASVPGVGGYFSSADEHPRTIDPFSNEREMFYINADVYRPGTEGYHAVLAHEFQHMIHWYQDPNEDTWVNEGASEFATKLNGYRLGGEQTAFTNAPDTQLNAWAEDPSRSIPHYGASYLFVTYFAQRFGADLVRDLVAAPENGIAGFDRVLREAGTGLRFDDLFQDWVIANYLDDPSLAEGRYGYEDLDVHVTPTEIIETYPAHDQATVHQYAADTIVLEPGPADVTVVFTGTETVKLLPNESHSGQYQWWSNRSDGSDATLTRSFDLTGLTEATLETWLWYDIEEDFDYAYVEVSADGGQTWDTLPSQHTTTSNPNGNNFGHGYTGRSRGGSSPEWIRAEMDLRPYAGQEIVLRFEYITDDAYNGPGFAVDDIAILELGTYDDAEAGDGGWVAQGFIRHDNQIPQRWSVQLIELGTETRGRPMVLDEHQQGRLVIEGLGNQVEQAVLVISALAPVTTEVASYQYEIRPGGS
jgi:immune inhibitor A